MSKEVSQEFKDWMEAQAAIRAWVRENPKQEIPLFLVDRLERTQAAYDNSKKAKQ